MKKIHLILLLAIALISCNRSSLPVPYGYYRIELPDTSYCDTSLQVPVRFDMSRNAQIEYKTTNDSSNSQWFDIVYPELNARIYCCYTPIRGNLQKLSHDANEFVYKHAVMADAIPERGFENAEANIYGILYELEGNTASPLQVVLTDSTRNFFRGALYFNSVPNRDSIAPVLDYMREDFMRMVETFRWE